MAERAGPDQVQVQLALLVTLAVPVPVGLLAALTAPELAELKAEVGLVAAPAMQEKVGQEGLLEVKVLRVA